MTEIKEYDFGNLHVVKTRIESDLSLIKFIEVSRNMGDYFLILDPIDPDYSKAIILSLNEENKNDSTI